LGVLRFLLALSVAWTHAGLPKGLSGDLCVTIFFVISGFYMVMVLSENRAYGKVIAFYKQRLLRLFPTYLVLLVLVLVFIASYMIPAIGRDWVSIGAMYRKESHLGLFITWLLSHLFIIGQDVFLFFGLDPSGAVIFTSKLSATYRPLADFLVIPPAWSLSLELVLIAVSVCAAVILTLLVAKPVERFRHRLLRTS